MIGITELLLILVVGLLIFGHKRVEELAGSLGRSVSTFKKGMKDATQLPGESDGSTTSETKKPEKH